MPKEGLRLGIQRTSLQDWPPHVAVVLFFPGCNLRCPWCHNPGLVEAPWDKNLLPWASVRAILEKRSGTHGALVASGGEALLHPDLVGVLSFCKSLGYKIRLDTNGTQPGRLAEFPHGLLDAIAMDIKLDAAGALLPGQAETLQIIRETGLPHEFRLLWSDYWHLESSLGAIAQLLGPGSSLRLGAIRPGPCLEPSWVHKKASSTQTLEKIGELLREKGIMLIL